MRNSGKYRPALFPIVMAIALLAGHAWAAGGAYIVDDADITPAGECQDENWMALGSKHDRTYIVSPACTFTALPRTEWTLLFQRGRADGDSTTGAGLAAKSVVAPQIEGGVGFAPTIGILYDATKDRMRNVLINLPVTYIPHPDIYLHINVGYLRLFEDERHFVTAGVGTEYFLSTQVSLGGEVFTYGNGPLGFQLGPRWTPFQWVDLDLIGGRRITPEVAERWLTLGATFKF